VKDVTGVEQPKVAKVVDIMEALRQSLGQKKKSESKPPVAEEKPSPRKVRTGGKAA
jgi:non-homologous end joining protein Ku